MKITAVVRSAEDITGQEGCVEFSIELPRMNLRYSKYMGDMAGQRIVLKWSMDRYDGRCYYWHKSWIKDIRTEMDWSEVKLDTKVIAGKHELRRYFSHYDKENDDVVVFMQGKTSWSSAGLTSYPSSHIKLADEE